jgi:hypothetical protein
MQQHDVENTYTVSSLMQLTREKNLEILYDITEEEHIREGKDNTVSIDEEVYSKIHKLTIPFILKQHLKEHLQEYELIDEDISILECERQKHQLHYCTNTTNFLNNYCIRKVLKFFYIQINEEHTINVSADDINTSMYLKIDRTKLTNLMKTRLKKYLQRFEFIGKNNPTLLLNKYEMMQLHHFTLTRDLDEVAVRKISKILYDKFEEKFYCFYYFNLMIDREIEQLKVSDSVKEYLKTSENKYIYDYSNRESYMEKRIKETKSEYLLLINEMVQIFNRGKDSRCPNDCMGIIFNFTLKKEYKELTGLVKKLHERLCSLAFISCYIENKNACIFTCNTRSTIDFLYFDNDTAYGSTLKNRAKEVASCKIRVESVNFETRVHDSENKWKFSTDNTVIPIIPFIHHSRTKLRVEECIAICKVASANVGDRINNSKLFLNVLNEECYCYMHEIPINI